MEVRSRRLSWLFVIGVLSVVALCFSIQFFGPEVRPLEKVTIALPRQASTAPMFVALDQGFFRAQGLDVVNQPHDLGAQGLQALIEHLADLTVVADTPFMFKVMGGEQIAIISAISSSRRAAAIAARPDRSIRSPADLSGHTVGLPLGTNMQFFLSLMLLQNRVAEDTVKLVNLRPEQVVSALQSGQVDAVAAWQGNLAELQEHAPAGTQFFFGEQLFRYRFHLVARRDYLAQHGDTVRKVVAAVAAAIQFMDEQPETARTITARNTGIELALLNRIYTPDDFDLKLDQAILIALDDQSRWAIRNGLVKRATVPDYLDYIYFDALQAVKPAAITMVR